MHGKVKVKLGGKLRGVHFGLGSLDIYCGLVGLDEADAYSLAFEPGPRRIGALSALVFAGLANYANIHDEEVDYNVPKVQAWLDEAPQKVAEDIIKAFIDSLPKPSEEVKEAPKKGKKSASKTS